jgi:hypothetical protein
LCLGSVNTAETPFQISGKKARKMRTEEIMSKNITTIGGAVLAQAAIKWTAIVAMFWIAFTYVDSWLPLILK